MSSPTNTCAPKLAKLRFSPELPRHVPELKLNQPKSTAWFSNDTSLSEQQIEHWVQNLKSPENPVPNNQRQRDVPATAMSHISDEGGVKLSSSMGYVKKLNEPLHTLMLSEKPKIVSQSNSSVLAPVVNKGYSLVPSSLLVSSMDLNEQRTPSKHLTTMNTDFETTWPEVEHDEDSGGVYVDLPKIEDGAIVEEEMDEMEVISNFVGKVKSSRA